MKHSTWKIISKHTFTLFNLVNLILALMVAAVGSYKNMLFLGVAIANTLIGIVNDLRAQKIVDQLRLLSEKLPRIERGGKVIEITPEEVEAGDHLILSLGDQIAFDATLEEGTIEVNEAFITGEQDNIEKRPGDQLISGSFVVAGSGKATVTHVGADNFVTKLQTEAHNIKTADSKLFRLMNNIVKYISYTLIPIGALLLWARFRSEADAITAITSTVAALINMIPEGLILLTSSILALATVRLGKRKVLVQDLYAIETLARVDTICLDKTGTLTTGKMTVKDLLLPGGTPVDLTKAATKSTPGATFLTALTSIASHQLSESTTATAVKNCLATLPHSPEIPGIIDTIAFSSARKYSGIKTKDAEYLMGAIEFLTDDKSLIAQVKSLATDSLRVLAVVKRTESVELLGIIRLEDEIRSTAPKIIKYFYDNEIDVKIISGDGLPTVQYIAAKVGVKNLAGINLSDLKGRKNYAKLVKEYGIFTRVTPAEKKELISALKKQGRTVAMTGDGVNDILAMKEADASLAIGEGSDAARRAAKFVLLDSGFEGIPSIIDEGRQSINNLERSTALFLAKTVYASILAVVFVFLPYKYPFQPIEMSLLSFACIGLPGLILALEKNTDPLKDRFTKNILEYSVPIGLTVSLAMVVLSIIAGQNHFSHTELTTTAVVVTFAIDLILIYRISRPLNFLRTALIFAIIGIMVVVFLIPLLRDFFEFAFLTESDLAITAALIVAAFVIFELLHHFLPRLLAFARHHAAK